jgi:hypothetical protein
MQAMAGQSPLSPTHNAFLYVCSEHIVTDLINALPGNNSVNTVQHITEDEDVFSVPSAPRPVLPNQLAA